MEDGRYVNKSPGGDLNGPGGWWGRLTPGGEFPNEDPTCIFWFGDLAGGQREFHRKGQLRKIAKLFGLSDLSEHSKFSETEACNEIRLRRRRSA